MSTVQGMLSSEQLQTLVEGEEIDTILVVFPDAFHMNSEVSEFARISIAFAISRMITNAHATRGRKV